MDQPPIHGEGSASELSEELSFETMLADISARFVSLPADDIDREIIDAQRQFCACLGVDVSSVWQPAADESGMMCLTHFCRPAFVPPAPEKVTAESFPWVASQVLAGKTVPVPSTANTPPEAARDRELWTRYGIKSTLALPLSVGGGPVFGVLVFAAIDEEIKWLDSTVSRCRVIAQVFANALARKRSERALRESEKRYRTLFESAPIGIAWIGMDGCVKAANLVQARMYGFKSADELLGYYAPKFVAEKDRARASQNLQAQLDGAEVPQRSFALVRRDGSEFIGEVSSGLLRGPQGEVQGYLCATRDITALVTAQENLNRTLEELHRLKEQLRHENVYLRKEVQTLQGQTPMVGNSESLKRVLAQAQQVAATDSTVLILGETGTGKELLANYLHRIGNRAAKPFIMTNVAAIPGTLLESELFGREKGAYTGALTRQIGRFEMADGGTLFLDEVGEMPLEMQSKLLRVLQEGKFERLGSGKTLHTDVRIIAATNRDLEKAVAEGHFRSDLYYRLNVFPIKVPPLRERRQDIPQLIWVFVKEFSERMGKPVTSIPKSTIESLERYPWPGNVRELRNVIERAMILCHGETLQIEVPEVKVAKATDGECTLDDIQRRHILQVLEQTNFRIRGPGGAADLLGIKPTTLESRMAKPGIARTRRSE